MRITRRFAAPALGVLLALGASGCAGLSFNTGCGLGAGDPMADGASRLNRGFQRHNLIAQQQAYQQKALMAGTQYSKHVRKPGSAPIVAQSRPSAMCFR
jgi:hypothetical protein